MNQNKKKRKKKMPLDNLITFLVKGITKYPEEVEIKAEKDQNNIKYKIKAKKDDIGSIIGKGGRIIKAIKDIARIKAIKEGKEVEIEIEER